MPEKIKGIDAWKYDTLCIMCRCIIAPNEDVYVIGAHVFHEDCLNWLLSRPKREFEEILRRMPLDTVNELRELYESKTGTKTSIEAKTAPELVKREGAEAPKPIEAPVLEETGRGEITEPEHVKRVLTTSEKRELWKRAIEIIKKALEAAGLKYAGEMKINGLAPEPYVKFMFTIRDKINELLKEPGKLEFKIHTYQKGFADTDIYVDGEYIFTWRPPDPYIGSFYNWTHRVYNLLRELAERKLLREEILEKKTPPFKPPEWIE